MVTLISKAKKKKRGTDVWTYIDVREVNETITCFIHAYIQETTKTEPNLTTPPLHQTLLLLCHFFSLFTLRIWSKNFSRPPLLSAVGHRLISSMANKPHAARSLRTGSVLFMSDHSSMNRWGGGGLCFPFFFFRDKANLFFFFLYCDCYNYYFFFTCVIARGCDLSKFVSLVAVSSRFIMRFQRNDYHDSIRGVSYR